MAGAKNHDYHILPPSIWPLMGAMSALVMAVGAVMWMHEYANGGTAFILGGLGVFARPFWRSRSHPSGCFFVRRWFLAFLLFLGAPQPPPADRGPVPVQGHR